MTMCKVMDFDLIIGNTRNKFRTIFTMKPSIRMSFENNNNLANVLQARLRLVPLVGYTQGGWYLPGLQISSLGMMLVIEPYHYDNEFPYLNSIYGSETYSTLRIPWLLKKSFDLFRRQAG
jgi:hypothetical protein